MSSATDMNTSEVVDDIDHLLFLCDRLSTRLVQVTSYVDEIKQVWMSKRRAMEQDSNGLPIVAQKVTRCNKIMSKYLIYKRLALLSVSDA